MELEKLKEEINSNLVVFKEPNEIAISNFFVKGDYVNDLIAEVKEEAGKHVPDVSTLKGRNAIKANITKIVNKKTTIEKFGKLLSADYKSKPKLIDSTRNKLKEEFEKLQVFYRKELTEWEVQEEIKKENDRIRIEKEKVQAKVDQDHELAIEQYKTHLREVADKKIADDIAAKELFRQQEKARIEREDKLKKDAAEEATRKAEESAAEEKKKSAEAKQKAIDDKLKAIDDKLKAEKEVIDAKARADLLSEQAKQRKIKQDWIDYISEAYRINDDINTKAEAKRLADVAKKDAEQARLMAEDLLILNDAHEMNNSFDAETKRLADIEKAKQVEISRQAYEKEKLRREAEQREADEKHTGEVHRAILKVLTDNGISVKDGKKMIGLAYKKLLPKLTINY